jgi:hypothetical protein
MSFFEDASLVLIPSAYKDQKIYSVKPTDGTGDLTFSRASSATRVQSDGLIEKVRTNLALYSEDLTNAAYIPQNATLTGNTTTAPDGTTTADTFNEGTLTTTHRFYQQFTITANQEYAFSFYAKKNTIDIIRLVVNDLSENFRWFGAQFNLTSGTITATATGSLGGATYIGGSIVDVGNGWYRCSINGTINATTALCFVNSSTSTAITSSDDRGGISYTGTSRTFFGWGTQFETGVTTDYIATTTAAVSVGPVSGLPRLDYLGSTCPKLLLEPQRSNLTQYSEQLNNAYWTKTGSTATANAIVSPDGYTNADLLTESATSADHAFFDVVSYFVSGTTYTLSFFAKANGRTKIEVVSGNSNTCPKGRFDLVAQTAVGIDDSFNAKIEDYGNGWFRCSVSRVAPNTGLDVPYHAMVQSFGTITYAGNGTSGMYFYGMQTEVGAYATSYIPTLGASVTRVADAASKTGITSLIGQTEGTLFVEVNDAANTGTTDRVVAIGDGTGANRIIVLKNASGLIYFYVESGGTMRINATGVAGTSLVNGNYKIAVAYKSGEYAIYFNGVSVFTSTEAVVPATSNYYLAVNEEGGVSAFSGKFSQALLFKTRLTNAQLAELTA